MSQGYNKNKSKTASDWVLEQATITSTAFIDGDQIDIKNIITDIEIYENLDIPYLTGNVILFDDSDLYNRIDFSGAEEITFTFVIPDPDFKPVTKTFYIHETFKNIRANDRASTVVLKIIEKHAFESILVNVNKTYAGKPIDIATKIITEYLNKEFKFEAIKTETQSPVKVIVPNVTPLQAAQWLIRSASTQDGVPYYFFSTLANDHLHIMNLEQMLTSEPDPTPYTFSQISTAYVASQSVNKQGYIIQSYDSLAKDDIASFVTKGMIGASHSYYDTTLGRFVENKDTHFSLKEELSNLIENNIIPQNQNRISYLGHNLNGTEYSNLNSRTITNLTTTGTFNEYMSYSESSTISDYKLGIISNTLKDLIKRNPIEISLPGRNFMDGSYSNTIGNQITCRFLKTVGTPNTKDSLDSKKSGDYIIYAMKHIFKKERYDVMARCVKLADIPDEDV